VELASTLVTAAGVLAALWIAIYAPSVLERRRRPILSLTCEVGLHKVNLLVHNASGRRTATGVELLVLDVEDTPGAVAQRPRSVPRVWSINRGILWDDQRTRIDVQANLTRRVTVLRLIPPEVDGHLPEAVLLTDPPWSVGVGVSRADIDSMLSSAPGLGVIADRPAQIRLALVADNRNAEYYTLRVGFPLDAHISASMAIFKGAAFSQLYQVSLTPGFMPRHPSPWDPLPAAN
jgi:hypothetical protein